MSHYRKGEAGDWRNHFDDDISEAFNRATGDLVGRLGYASYERPAGHVNGRFAAGQRQPLESRSLQR